MPRLVDLQKRMAAKEQWTVHTTADRDEVLVADRRSLLTPAEVVDAKFWAALSATRFPAREGDEQLAN